MIFLYIIVSFLFLYYIFLILLKEKVIILEKEIIRLFYKRNNLIPPIYEITKSYFTKHYEIFDEINNLRKQAIFENRLSNNINNIIYTQKLIHNELNFILQLINKHPKLNRVNKFLYIKELLLEESQNLGKNLILYKKMTSKINKMIFYKNLTILGLFLPIKKIDINL